jgi:hypothetical protein
MRAVTEVVGDQVSLSRGELHRCRQLDHRRGRRDADERGALRADRAQQPQRERAFADALRSGQYDEVVLEQLRERPVVLRGFDEPPQCLVHAGAGNRSGDTSGPTRTIGDAEDRGAPDRHRSVDVRDGSAHAEHVVAELVGGG